MSKKSKNKPNKKGRTKSHSLNTGLADCLGGISLDDSTSFPSGNKQATSQKNSMPDSKSDKKSDLLDSKGRQSKITTRSIRSDLAETFDKMISSTLNGQCSCKLNPDTNNFCVAKSEPRFFPSLNGTEKMLPRNKLYLWDQLPKWDNTKNYVNIRIKKRDYAFPIHSWISVVESCEAIYKDYDNRLLIRKESHNAIAGIIQSYFDRGISLDLIDRGRIERKVRKRLDKIYGKSLELKQKRLQYDKNTKAAFEETTRKHSERLTYEERIRAYRERNPHDASTARPSVRRRLDEYINAKTNRIGDGAIRTLDGAFTYKKEDARTVWIGLDYGTQNVKVVFRDSDEDDQSVILELDPAADGIDKFMISPVTLVDNDRVVHRLINDSRTPSWKHALSFYYGDSFAEDDADIRSWMEDCNRQSSAFAERSVEDLVLFFASIHIAFLLDRVGHAIRSYYQDRSIADELAFRVFMCAPVAALDQQLCPSVFQDCLTIADEMHGLLDFSTGNIAVQDALNAYDKARRLGILLDQKSCRRSRVVPEVLAEITSFTQSRSVQEGVYALVDIGAGTLDLNVFKVLATRDDAVRTPVYAASCHPNGVKHLESLLLEVLGTDTALAGQQIEEQKMHRQFPDVKGFASDFEHMGINNLCDCLERAHQAYCDDVANRTRVTWGEAWGKRGLERKPWTKLTMFLCGGGANIRDVRERLEKGMPEQIISNITHSVLPCPSEEEFRRPVDFPEEDFHRVAVAYGLTFGSDFEPYSASPSEISKVRVFRETVDVESCYVSKDMV